VNLRIGYGGSLVFAPDSPEFSTSRVQGQPKDDFCFCGRQPAPFTAARLDVAKPGVLHATPPFVFFRRQGRKQILSTALSSRWQVCCERPDSLGRWPARKDFK
jgi:hypothetical protein